MVSAEPGLQGQHLLAHRVQIGLGNAVIDVNPAVHPAQTSVLNS